LRKSVSMNNSNNIIWEERTQLKPNLWGLRSEGSRLRVSLLTGTGSSDNDRISPIAAILWSLILLPLSSFIVGFFSLVLMYLWILFYLGGLFYWLVIREIKYFQMTKSTTYAITDYEVITKSKTFGKNKTFTIPIEDIKKVHIVKYTEEGIETGSIFLYLDYHLDTYNLTKKERSHQFVIERVFNFEEAKELLLEA